MKPVMKAELLEAQSRNLGNSIFERAASEARQIVINGEVLRGRESRSPRALADLLNGSLKRHGDNVRFEFDDGSFLKVTEQLRGSEKGLFIAWGYSKRQVRP